MFYYKTFTIKGTFKGLSLQLIISAAVTSFATQFTTTIVMALLGYGPIAALLEYGV
jgi:large-conductance mechanosensitive channel